jgi:hypothetical protein
MAPSRKEQIVVERHAFDALVIFEITGQELDEMERETLSLSEDFSFAIAGLSIAITLASVIFTVKIDSERIYETFVIMMTLGFVVALYCGIRWFRGRKTFKGVVQKIKSRAGPREKRLMPNNWIACLQKRRASYEDIIGYPRFESRNI